MRSAAEPRAECVHGRLTTGDSRAQSGRPARVNCVHVSWPDIRPGLAHPSVEERPFSSGVSDDAVRDYLQQLRRFPLVDAQTQHRLADCLDAGTVALRQLAAEPDLSGPLRTVLETIARDGRLARRVLVLANLRLVVAIAKRHRHRGVDFMDLIQEGNLALARAVDTFDPSRGSRLASYVAWHIAQSMARITTRGARFAAERPHGSASPGRSGRSAHDLAGYEAPLTEFTERVDLGLDAARMLRDVHRVLGFRSAQVLALRFGLAGHNPRTLQQIGVIFGLSRERVRQIEARALTFLRDVHLEGVR